MWSYGSEHFDKNRMKKYQKKHGAEVASCMSNLKRAVSMLDEGKTLEEICRFSFFGSEGEDVYRIGQSAVRHAKETRLYIYVQIVGQRIELLTIGGKGTQSRDIQECKTKARTIKQQQEEAVQNEQQKEQ
jgi:hypothetical protein